MQLYNFTISFDQGREADLICAIIENMEEIILIGLIDRIPMCLQYIEVVYGKAQDFQKQFQFHIKAQIFRFYSSMILVQIKNKSFNVSQFQFCLRAVIQEILCAGQNLSSKE